MAGLMKRDAKQPDQVELPDEEDALTKRKRRAAVAARNADSQKTRQSSSGILGREYSRGTLG